MGRIEEHTVVAPITLAGEIRNRHNLDRGHAELNEMIKFLYRRKERTFFRKGPIWSS